ncbi:MAG: DUF4268 domain-containing protein [Candidatus Puniceispirillaceae bacterium]
MYEIDKANNALISLQNKSFKEAGFEERPHLQQWIAQEPSCLGEDLLIIQEEFQDFSETNERLDLLALDKEGRLVIIENKLDDSGKDIIGQALKYASYCASMTTDQICQIYQKHLHSGNARDLIAEFLDVDDLSEVKLNPGFSQRLFLIAGNFRKEITSAVVWLMEFHFSIKCFRVTLWSQETKGAQEEGNFFLNFEQVIPTQDTEEFRIGLTKKANEEANADEAKKQKYRAFWSELLNALNNTDLELYSKTSPRAHHWMGAQFGMFGFNFVASKTYGRAELYIDRRAKEDIKYAFDCLEAKRKTIEEDFKNASEKLFDGELVWERKDETRASRIKCETSGDVFNRDDWPEMIAFMTDTMVRIERAFREPVEQINAEMKNRPN